MERLSSSFGLLIALMIFSLSPASASSEDLRGPSDFLSNNILDEGNSAGDKNVDGQGQTHPFAGGMPQSIMNKIFEIMKNLHSDSQNKEPMEMTNTIPSVYGPTEVADTVPIAHSVETNAILPNHGETSLNKPSPTPETPTSNDKKDEDIWIKTKKRTHFDFEVYRKNANGTSVSKFSTPDVHETADNKLDDHLKSLWASSVPVLVKNNQASVHPDVEYSDMSKVFPDLPTLLQKLHEVHQPGHVSVVIMNPQHLPVNKVVVQHTKICCEMRHILMQAAHNDIEPEPQSSSPYQEFLNNIPQHHSSEDEPEHQSSSPYHQDFLNNIPQHYSSEDEPEPTEEDHHESEESEDTWNPQEKHVVSRIMNNLHFFDSPGHISAISFNPRHVTQKKNPVLLHLRIKIHIPLGPLGHSSEDSELDHPYTHGNDEVPYAYGDHNSEDIAEPLPEPEAEVLPQTQIHMTHMRFRHQSGTLSMHHIPLHHLLDSFQDDLPSTPPPQEQTTHHVRKTMIYFVHHGHLHVEPVEPEQSPNIRSLLHDIFHIPSQGEFPSEEDEPITHEETPEESFQSMESGEQPSLQDFFSQMLSESQHPEVNSAEESRPSTSTEREVPSFQSEREEPTGSEQVPPLEIFKLFNMNGDNLSPQSVSSEGAEVEEPATSHLPLHRVRIIRFRPRPSGDDEALKSLLG